MTDMEDIRRRANIIVRRFQEDFYKIFGAYPVVTYHLSSEPLPRLDLFVLEDLINLVYQTNHPKLYTSKGIRTRVRKRDIVIYRQVFFYLAQALGHGPKHASQHLGFNHATAIYSRENIKNLLDAGDTEVTRIFNNVIYEYKKRFSNDGAIQQDGSQELISG